MLQVEGTGNSILAVASSTPQLTYLDISNQNAATGNNGAILRLITENAEGTGQVSVDFVKYAFGGLWLNNNEMASAAFTSFGVGAAEL